MIRDTGIMVIVNKIKLNKEITIISKEKRADEIDNENRFKLNSVDYHVKHGLI